jgi:hypothetical protein
MIARLFVQLPYAFTRSLADNLGLWQCEHRRYSLTIYPPDHREDQPMAPGDEITIDGSPNDSGRYHFFPWIPVLDECKVFP